MKARRSSRARISGARRRARCIVSACRAGCAAGGLRLPRAAACLPGPARSLSLFRVVQQPGVKPGIEQREQGRQNIYHAHVGAGEKGLQPGKGIQYRVQGHVLRGQKVYCANDLPGKRHCHGAYFVALLHRRLHAFGYIERLLQRIVAVVGQDGGKVICRHKGQRIRFEECVTATSWIGVSVESVGRTEKEEKIQSYSVAVS